MLLLPRYDGGGPRLSRRIGGLSCPAGRTGGGRVFLARTNVVTKRSARALLTVVGGRGERTVHLLRFERTAHSSADWFESIAAADAKNGSPARCWMAARGRWRGEGGWWQRVLRPLLGCDTFVTMRAPSVQALSLKARRPPSCTTQLQAIHCVTALFIFMRNRRARVCLW